MTLDTWIFVYLLKALPAEEAFLEKASSVVWASRLEEVRHTGQDNRALRLAVGMLLSYAVAEAEKYQERKAALRFSKLTGGRMISLPLSSFAPIEIARAPGGKPYLTDRQGLYFNLSHSGEYALCAISNREIGADIQEHRKLAKALPARVLTQKEQAYLNGKEDFFDCFCAKESYVKCSGEGLSRDFRTLTLQTEKKQIRRIAAVSDESPAELLTCPIQENTGKLRQIYFLPAPAGYSLTVCTDAEHV